MALKLPRPRTGAADTLPYRPEERIEIGAAIGAQIRALRRAKQWTLQDLADQIGMSIGYISQVERGRSVMTIAALMRISDAFGVPMNYFFQPATASAAQEQDVVVRAANRKQLTFPGLGITEELLSPDLNGPLEVLLSTIEPGADSAEPYSHAGAEAGVVIAGTLDLWVGERFFRLETGDSFSFKSTIPHRCANPGKTPTRVVWIITPPSY
jgi:transcriptional regulator with XRE-family HTH domain